MEEFIELKKGNLKRFGIKDIDGNVTGNYIEFDMEDIELPLKMNESKMRHRQNVQWIKNEIQIISKKQDSKDKNSLISKNQESQIKALKEFYKKEEEALDLFLGENGTKKLLNGRNPYYGMYEDIDSYLTPIMKELEESANDITSKIKSKYKLESEEVI